MSSFFTDTASQRKRKREDTNTAPTTKRRHTSTKASATPQNPRDIRARRRDESISSESEDDARPRKASDEEVAASESESEDGEETGAERRLRLASQYLEKIKGDVDEIGFDAEDIDRDLIAERLKEDVAETKGRLYRHIASTLDFSSATETNFRAPTLSVTSVATCAPYAYTVSKDITLIAWELPTPPLPPPPNDHKPPQKAPRPIRRRPVKLVTSRGNKHKAGDSSYQHHVAPILCVAASHTGQFVATGGADKRLIIWSAKDLKPLRVFTQHRDAVTSLAFRKGTNQLYSGSLDRTVKIFSLDELAYVETLFGHQDEVVDVAALALERCVSVGARDRTARLWKVVDQTQLVFRGGGSSEKRRPRSNKETDGPEVKSYSEGSIDRVALIDDQTFVTGSDNGSISLWSLQKKKPIFTVPLAHGLDPPIKPEEASADVISEAKVPEPQPRWITALATIPLSDLVVSGSWDGEVRIWKVSEDKRRLEALGILGKVEGNSEDNEMAERYLDGGQGQKAVRGVINDLSVFERGERGEHGLCVVAALATEHRLGRWKKVYGKNGAVVFEVPKVIKGADGEEDSVVQKGLVVGTEVDIDLPKRLRSQ